MSRKKPSTSLNCSLRKPEYNRPAVRNQDLASCIMDEVALEGLDGITFQALLVRLSIRPGFHMNLNEKAKTYIWEIAKRQRHLSIYLLEENRPDLVLLDRRDSVDERGNMFEPVNAPEDIYPYHPVDDHQTGQRGSCKEYYTRRPYTSVARQMKFEKIQEKYGSRLVFVVPQQIREKVLTSDDSNLDLGELSVIQYCILERVARARYVGEVTRGHVSLASMKIDPKSSFYQRKLILKKGLITKQTLSMKFGPNRVSAGVTVLHLPKFYTYYETILKSAVGKTIKAIHASPKNRKEVTQLRHDLGKHQLHNLLSTECSHIFEEVSIPFHKAYPTAYELERVPERRHKMTQKSVKYLTLRDLRITPFNFATLLLTKGGEEKEESEDPSLAYLPIRNTATKRNSFHTTQTSILNNLVHVIYESRARGASLVELSERSSITQLDARSAVRLLQRHKIVVAILEDKKKTKMHRYVYFKFQEANRNYQTVSKPCSNQPQPSSSSSVALAPPAIDERVFMDLDGEQEALDGEIIWTVRDLELVTEDEGGREEEAAQQPIVPAATPDTGKGAAKGTSPIRKKMVTKDKEIDKKRRGNSYQNTENSPTTNLKLNSTVQRIVEDFLSTCDPEVDEFQPVTNILDLRFNQAEERDFVPLRQSDKARCLVYINPSGWHILAELADIRPEFGRLPSFATSRTTDRGNYILELIYKLRVVIGFQQILRGMRTHEASLAEGKDKLEIGIDRRTLYRILGQLQYTELIQILRVRIQKDAILKTFALFTPFSVNMESKLVTSCIEHIVSATVGKSRQSAEERKARNARNRFVRSNARKQTGKSVASGSPLERTKVRARPGTKPGSKILRKVVRGARYANKATVKPKKIKAADPKDLEALARIKRVRVDWTSMEDRFILASFLASVLFISRYNFQKIFMFNASQIRDLLHIKLERGRCKTSLAIRRRLHFLMKKQSFYSRYRYYLSEALQDTFLYNKHLKSFHDKRTEKIFVHIPTQRLLAVIEYLQKKFQKLSIDPNVLVRDTDEPFEVDWPMGSGCRAGSLFYENGEVNPNRKIRITFHQAEDCIMVDALDTPFDSKSISVWTTRTAILSLLMSGDEVGNVHRFLASVSDDILSYTINTMRMVGITTWQKETSRFGPSMALKRKLQSSLSPDKYADGSIFLNEFDVTMRKDFPANEQLSVGIFYLLCELNSQNLLDFGITMADPTININPEWRDVFQAIAEGVDESILRCDEDDFRANVPEETKRWDRMKRNRSKRSADIQLDTHSSKRPRFEESTQAQKRHGSTTSPEPTLGPVEEAIRTDATLTSTKAMKISNKAMKLIRSEINSNESTNFVERHFFSVNLPEIEALGDRAGFDQIISQGAKPKLALKEIKTHLIKVISCSRIPVSDTVEALAKPTKLGRWEQLYDYIASTKEIGISLQFLRTKFTRSTLNEGLRFLIIRNAIFLVGVAYRKFVTLEFIQSWTMPAIHDQDSLILRRVVFRPWITNMGLVHWGVLDQTLSAVLGYVSLHPDLSVEALCDHFIPVLSPVETMIIIDALVGFEFFNLYALERKEPKSTAFSPPSLVSKNYSVDTFLDMESLHVELSTLTASKYSKLQQLFTSEESSELDIQSRVT